MIQKLNKIKLIILGFTIVAGLTSLSVIVAPQASAAFQPERGLCGGSELKLSGDTCGGAENQNKLDGVVGTIINIISIIVGIVAVIMIIIGGFKFITSSGDSGRLTSAKQTIIYAIVGLIIVALAQFIVRFVLTRI